MTTGQKRPYVPDDSDTAPVGEAHTAATTDASRSVTGLTITVDCPRSEGPHDCLLDCRYCKGEGVLTKPLTAEWISLHLAQEFRDYEAHEWPVWGDRDKALVRWVLQCLYNPANAWALPILDELRKVHV